MKRFLLALALLLLCLISIDPLPVSAPVVLYDIVYVRSPRKGDTTEIRWQEVILPYRVEPGTDLMLLHPDGTEQVLVDSLGIGAAVDPALSFDAQWVYYTLFTDARPFTGTNIPTSGSDLYKINLATHQVVRLTNQEWTPTTGAGNWSSDPRKAVPAGTNYLGFGIFNAGPCPLPGGKLAFVSTRNGNKPNTDYLGVANYQLFVMDEVHKTVEQVGYLNLGNALHPFVLTDGRIGWSSAESQGRHDQRLWGLWVSNPDGRGWGPLLSAFVSRLGQEAAAHLAAQSSNGDIVTTLYYNQNNNGFGPLVAFTNYPPNLPLIGMARFGSPVPTDPSNPDLPNIGRTPFSPVGLHTLTPLTNLSDRSAPNNAGKFRDPAPTLGNSLLVTYSHGPVHGGATPVVDSGIYLIPQAQPITNLSQLVLIKNDPAYNEHQPRAVLTYQAIYGIPEPATLPWLPNDGSTHPLLPPGTPYGLVGTSSLYKRNTTPGVGLSQWKGLEPFNSAQNDVATNWTNQGAEAGIFTNADIYSIRFLVQEPLANRAWGPNQGVQFFNIGRERYRILGDIPVRKFKSDGTPVLDVDGNPDTSFLARIPADTAFTFQMLDKRGMVLSMAETWHMVRPGEMRNDCGGCHAHAQVGTDFARTAAGQPGFPVTDLSQSKGTTVEYYRDVKPLFARACVSCHSQANPQGQLVLDDTTPVQIIPGYEPKAERSYVRLAYDPTAQFGIKPIIPAKIWRYQPSRYVRPYQARRSLLAWIIWGQRLDGWTNADHPTESTPGDPATLPTGANANDADLDYTPQMQQDHAAVVASLTEVEQRTVSTWIDLGMPVNAGPKGWFLDENRPSLSLFAAPDGSSLILGAADHESGLDMASWSVSATISLTGEAVGSPLAPLLVPLPDSRWQLTPQCPQPDSGILTARIKDKAGNLKQLQAPVTCAAPPAASLVIVTQPQAQLVTLDCKKARFTVEVQGPGTIAYQAQRNGVNIPGVIVDPGGLKASIETGCLTPAENGSTYGFVVQNATTVLTTQPAPLTVTQP